eukprot:Blabericola_migrator_1__8873@NODE_4699_length_1014_cov_1000_035903_g2314_i1_p1_GENE_NODE_4699_length_1014_cov_1000_035903_g2314_i1NODE_4699_length_1014_cov_1000_035903_g2314_i1_p1_ORF_typecomplete_len243_score44_69Integrin_beta/PF00362_18/1_4e07NusG_add/PF18298_1/0_083Inhibitor_I78/PF11720_8/1_5e02Inhibitor_I78/PF11720_8/4_NODE_4699_length_1014_cov_1000_035903_g2314_i195823
MYLLVSIHMVLLSLRLIVLVTDAAPHFADDGMNTFNLPPFSGYQEPSEDKDQCVDEYYPSPDQVKKAIVQREAYLATLVYDGSYGNSLPLESWKWFNNFLGQSEGFVHDMEDDSSNFWERLSEIIQELEDIECGVTTTEGPPVTTEPDYTVTIDGEIQTTATTTRVATPAAATTPDETTEADVTITIDGGIQTTPAPTAGPECPPISECPPVCPPIGCDPCCPGVVIKLNYRPKRLHLEVEK